MNSCLAITALSITALLIGTFAQPTHPSRCCAATVPWSKVKTFNDMPWGTPTTSPTFGPQTEESDSEPNAPDATDAPDAPIGAANQSGTQEPAEEPGTDPGPVDPTTGNPPQQADSDAATAADPPTQDVGYEKFMSLLQEIQSNSQMVNQLVVSMPVGFPEKRNEMQAKVDALRLRNQAVLDEIHAAALESFENFPNTQQQVSNYLMRHLEDQLTGKNYRRTPFDPVSGLRTFQQLSEGGVTLPILNVLGYRNYYLLNDFDTAEIELKKAAKATPERVGQRVIEDLKRVQEIWQQESDQRKQDAENENPRVQIEMDCGTMVVELFEDQVPNTVANFINLVEDGFYNGLLFYQVNPKDVAITGSPSNDGQGGPGYFTKTEAGVENARHHFTGVLSMLANPDGQATHGSRFLITKQPHLEYDGRITPFGRIVEGLENLYKINVINLAAARTIEDGIRPTQIIRMTVLRKRDHEYIAEKATANAATPSGG